MTTSRRPLRTPHALPRTAAAVVALCLLALEAGAMGRIRIPPEWTNQPPVVVTNAPAPVEPPAATNSPAPQPEPPQALLVWGTPRTVWQRGLPWKAMFTLATPRGVLLSTYNRDSRTDSELHILEAGATVPRNLYRGPEETIGELPTPAAVRFGEVIVCAAERGDTTLLYDLGTGKVRRGAKIPGGRDYKWNVFATLWRGRPVVGAAGPDKASIVFDGLTGAKLATSPLKGLVAGMAEAPGGSLWLAISDGQHGLAEVRSDGTAGVTVRTVKTASVAAWRGGIYAGGMDDGRLWRLVDGKLVQFADLRCSKINRLVVDPRRDVLLAAGAKPDTFVAIHPDGRMEQLARFEDEKQEKSGEQFDADISPASGDGVLLARAHAKGCTFLLVEPKR